MHAPLSRAAGTPVPPVRLLHLGLGSFFRAHQAWYTAHAPDSAHWGYAAFASRSPGLATALAAQDGLYTLVVRGPDEDAVEVVESVVAVHTAEAQDAWLRSWRDPALAVVTLTVTEAGYRFDPTSGPDADAVAALREDVTTPVPPVVARLTAGLAARRAAGAGGVVLLPCDNLPANGEVLRGVVLDCAERVEPALAGWIREHVTFGSSMVDRITPATTDALIDDVERATGYHDAVPVPTEPFAEWVIASAFPQGRPAWAATFVDDVRPYEERKLWLLNGAHTLLAYVGRAAGHVTVAEAIADPACRAWVERWWDEASSHLELGGEHVSDYRATLLERFSNPRIRHELAQIAGDGSEKVRARILPVLRAERAAGRLPAAACHIVGAWVVHLRTAGAQLRDPSAGDLHLLAAGELVDAVPRVLTFLDPVLARDAEVLDAVLGGAVALSSRPSLDLATTRTGDAARS